MPYNEFVKTRQGLQFLFCVLYTECNLYCVSPNEVSVAEVVERGEAYYRERCANRF